MTLLIQFLLRLSFGLAAGMTLTSSKHVTSGYFRNHLYVTLGLTSLAAVLSWTNAPDAFWFAVGAALASYVGAVGWLYEKQKFGKVLLLMVTFSSLAGALMQNGFSASLLAIFSNVSSGLLLGMTMASMLLGHWYLNSPTMEMAPLRRLIVLLTVAVALRTIAASLGLWGEVTYANSFSTQWFAFIALRWTFGLIGVAILTWMAWQTLKIPNTQSATGILYVAVIGTFVGETMSLLLSSESLFPL